MRGMKLISSILKVLASINFLVFCIWFSLRFYREIICGYLNLANDYLAPESCDNLYTGFVILMLHVLGARWTFKVSCTLVIFRKLLSKKYIKLTCIVIAVSLIYIVRDWIKFAHLWCLWDKLPCITTHVDLFPGMVNLGMSSRCELWCNYSNSLRIWNSELFIYCLLCFFWGGRMPSKILKAPLRKVWVYRHVHLSENSLGHVCKNCTHA